MIVIEEAPVAGTDALPANPCVAASLIQKSSKSCAAVGRMV